MTKACKKYDNLCLSLSLSHTAASSSSRSEASSSHQNTPSPHTINPTSANRRIRLGLSVSSRISKKKSTSHIPPPFPWASDTRARLLAMEELEENQIHTIYGDLECKRCGKKYSIGYDLTRGFHEVVEYIVKNKEDMHQRAPEIWMKPVRPPCVYCGKVDGVRPVMEKKRGVNWLFLLLSGLLGLCCIKQLKYFCKYNDIHRSGAKNRLLYLVYINLCKQLQPLRFFGL